MRIELYQYKTIYIGSLFSRGRKQPRRAGTVPEIVYCFILIILQLLCPPKLFAGDLIPEETDFTLVYLPLSIETHKKLHHFSFIGSVCLCGQAPLLHTSASMLEDINDECFDNSNAFSSLI